MLKNRGKKTGRWGFSIIEVMVACVVIAVAVVGTSGFRYHSSLDWRRAVRHTSAARAAILLSESWRGSGGDEEYDPVSHLSANTNIAEGDGPDQPSGYTLLGSYTLSVNGTVCYATLSWKDVDDGLRALNVAVAGRSEAKMARDTITRINGLSLRHTRRTKDMKKNTGPGTMRNSRPGITIVELIIAVCISIIVVCAIGVVLVDSQRGWRAMWDKTNADIVSGGFAAGRRFDSALRKASSIAANVADDGSSIEVYCYESSGSTNLDRYQRMFKSGDDLMYEYGVLFPRETLFLQTVCGNVTGCVFNHLHRGAQMTLTLDDGEQTNTVVSSAYMHNY